MSYIQKLTKAVQAARSCLCVGLDPNLELIPEPIKDHTDDPCRQVELFLKKTIDSTQDYCSAYKPNLGFFEALGAGGLRVFQQVIDHIPDDKIIIADAKRGDISSTAEHYAKAYFQVFDVDAITLNPLMGFETLTPFLDYPDKGIYTLTLTSNPGASDFLTQRYDKDQTIAAYIASKLSELGKTYATHLGMVVGATKPDQIRKIIELSPSSSLLIPGIGTQGGSVSELSQVLQGHKGIPLVNSSRSIIYAGKNSPQWDQAVADKAKEYQQALTSITQSYV